MTLGPNRDWDARAYHQVTQPHAAWGASVLDRLQLQGNETVLDAGCGSGRVTAGLLDRLPSGHVIAADLSAAMLTEARTTLAAYGERVSYLEVDLLQIHQALHHNAVDAIFSTATFHWIADHAALFKKLHDVLRPGGQMVAQCGGGANLARFMSTADTVAQRKPFRDTLHGQPLWRHQYGADETRQRLHQAGFEPVEVWLEDSPQHFDDAPALAAFARTVVLSRHVAALPESLRDDFVTTVVQAIAEREGSYSLDYVRLNIDAWRPARRGC
ncbi:MAG TPA: methyltransferase domain-containing protein [Chloroflexota bacterium]|nr:methyltransferase domain-containing protein [Chloroflexota bacterium]